MKNWRNYLVLGISIVLLLVSFIIFGIHLAKTVIPPGSTPQQIEQLTQQYGLDRPVIDQYRWFLFTFLPGLTLLGIYATVGLRKLGFQQGILVKIFIVLMMITNTITILNFLVTAQASMQDSLLAFLTSLAVAGLALANFIFLLYIWNGFRWSAWAFGLTSFVLCTLKFVGQVPIFPVLFEFSSVAILVYLLRYSWQDMK